jgi:hypothetical protein
MVDDKKRYRSYEWYELLGGWQQRPYPEGVSLTEGPLRLVTRSGCAREML